jgi:3-phenylpropionate/trans-cinnamate dioxygenase ferredoxin subunit
MVGFAAKVTDVPSGEARQVIVEGQEVCLANLGEDGFRAIGDLCSHAEAQLHEGEVDVEEATIECPRHGSLFDLNTGKPRSLPATLPVAAYTVTTQGDDILIEVK